MSSKLVVAAAAVAALALTTACSRESAFAQTLRDHSVKGKYAYAGQGSTATIPWKFDAVLKLDGRGKYDLEVTVDVKEDHDKDFDHGSYRVDGDRLYLDDDKGDDNHMLIIRGDSLFADTGWKGDMFLRMIGVPKPIFVKQ